MNKDLLNQVLTGDDIEKAMSEFALHSSQFIKMREQFNVFSFCTDRHKEKFHDQIIAYLLDPAKPHELGATPLHLFIELLKKLSKEQKKSDIAIEEREFKDVTVKIASPGDEEPDIRISNHHNEHILIEDKIYGAIDQTAQLERYYSKYQEKGEVRAMIYLSPHTYKQPSEQTFGSRKNEIEKILVTLYAFPQSDPSSKKPDLCRGWLDLCRGWVEPMLKHAITTTDNIDIIACIRQYKLLLEQLGGNYMSDAFSGKVMSSLLNDDGKTNGDEKTINKEKFNLIIAIKGGGFYPVPYIRNKIKEDIQKRLSALNKIKPPLTIGEHPPQVIYLDFIKKAQPEKRYRIDIAEFSEWGKWWHIQISARNSEGALSANTAELESIRQKLPKEFRQIDDRLCYNGEAGLEYIGHEDKFCEIVINALRTFDINSIENAPRP